MFNNTGMQESAGFSDQDLQRRLDQLQREVRQRTDELAHLRRMLDARERFERFLALHEGE